MILHSGIILYHGSYVTVEKPELERCYPYKDFGRGFYLTTSQEQAVSFVRSSVAKAAGRGDVQPNTKWGFVSKYIFQTDINIKIHEFPNADAAWLHCVASHRRPTLSVDWAAEWQDYDILAGKVANDRTNPTITAYLAGLFGEVGSMRADEQCVSMLMPENLENQICLRTPAALACISVEGSEKVVCR